jgi:hypothetical protein
MTQQQLNDLSRILDYVLQNEGVSYEETIEEEGEEQASDHIYAIASRLYSNLIEGKQA